MLYYIGFSVFLLGLSYRALKNLSVSLDKIQNDKNALGSLMNEVDFFKPHLSFISLLYTMIFIPTLYFNFSSFHLVLAIVVFTILFFTQIKIYKLRKLALLVINESLKLEKN